MRLISVIEPIQIGDITVMPGGYEKPVTEWTGRWVGESLYAVRCVNPFDHPSHVMVIYRPAGDPQPSPEPEWFDLTPFGEHVLRKKVDFIRYDIHSESDWFQPVGVSAGHTIASTSHYIAKARCLLKDAPPELVAKASKPSEDPDEWVTQDRVPARPLIDERRWVNQSGKAYGFGWVTVGKGGLCDMKHGDVANGDRLELRCRRKDLPPMPEPKPKTETVTFHECMVKHSFDNEPAAYHLSWTTEVPKHGNWIPTGRAETREVVR